MSSHFSVNKTHFASDDRCLGGAMMIQQQFLHMYQRIHNAHKAVDDDAPQTSMFRRSYFNQIHKEPWQKVAPLRAMSVKGKVDHSAPESYEYLRTLFINQPRSARSPRTLGTVGTVGTVGTPRRHRHVMVDKAKPSAFEAHMATLDVRRAELHQELRRISARKAQRLTANAAHPPLQPSQTRDVAHLPSILEQQRPSRPSSARPASACSSSSSSLLREKALAEAYIGSLRRPHPPSTSRPGSPTTAQ